MKTPTENDLVCFAECVLSTLQQHEDWNADTLDEIADEAYTLKLAYADSDGRFRRSNHDNPS